MLKSNYYFTITTSNSNIIQQNAQIKIAIILAIFDFLIYNTYTVLGGELVVPYIRNPLYAERNTTLGVTVGY